MLWTIQNEAQWQHFQHKGVLTALATDTISADFEKPYQWMMQQMAQRIAPRPDTHYPIWCWHTYWNAQKRRPDLRQAAHLPKGTKGVLLSFEATEKEVLLSDFDLWHHVLNGFAIAPSVALARQLDEWWHLYPQTPYPPHLQHEIEKTWEKIFDLDWQDSFWTEKRTEKRIQGCLWEIRWEQISAAQSFTAR